MPERIKGLVAGVLNERELAINIGRSAGVQQGMRFKIMEKPRAILDPATKEEIGFVSREKIRVIVHDVQDRMSIAQTYQTYEQRVGGRGGLGGLSSRIFEPYEPERIVKKVRTLRRDPNADIPALDEDSSLVQTGDPVEQVEEDEQKQ